MISSQMLPRSCGCHSPQRVSAGGRPVDMAPKKDKDKPPEFMTISGQLCRRVKDSSGKFVYRPVQADGTEAGGQTKPKNDEEEEKKWIQMKEREVQEARLRDARQQSAKQMREKEKLGLVEKSGRAREPTVKVPAALQRLREEHEAALKVGMQTSKPGEYILIKEALNIEEKRYHARVKDAKEKAYKRTRGKLRVAGRAGIGDSDEDLDEEDTALVPKQELHDIDDYRRDMPVKKATAGRGAAQPTLWSANGQSAAPLPSDAGHVSARPASVRPGRGRGGNAAHAAQQDGSMDMSDLGNALPSTDAGGRGRGRGRRGGGGRGGGARGRGSGPSDEAFGENSRPASARPRSKGGNRGRGRGSRGRGHEPGGGLVVAANNAG
eukprot:jgi/Tetstr1/463460/TSEL_008353.t1